MNLVDFTDRHARVLKWIAVIVLAPGALMTIVMVTMIARSQYLHDATRCPFHRVGAREVGVSERVVEEARRCEDGIEERRWVLERPGKPPDELGRRRLALRLYETPGYRWRADVEKGYVHLVVHNPGIADRSFHEHLPFPGKPPQAAQ